MDLVRQSLASEQRRAAAGLDPGFGDSVAAKSCAPEYERRVAPHRSRCENSNERKGNDDARVVSVRLRPRTAHHGEKRVRHTASPALPCKGELPDAHIGKAVADVRGQQKQNGWSRDEQDQPEDSKLHGCLFLEQQLP